MVLGTHAQGFVGIAFETVYGTFVPAVRFFPIKSETFSEQWQTQDRRLIRGIADNIGKVQGYHHAEGEIETELLEDLLPYWLHVMRNTSVVKTGTTPNFIYTTTPGHFGSSASLIKPSISVTIVKNGVAFGYRGCVVGALEITQDNGIPSMKVNVLGSQETEPGALPTYAGLTTDIPFNAGMFSIEIPTATMLTTVENFTFAVNDNPEPQFRASTNSGATWIKFGQRDVTLELNLDFVTRADWDAFKALTASTITLKCTRNANKEVSILMSNAVRSAVEIESLSDQGSATMQQITWDAAYNAATSKSYEIVCKTLTDIT